MEPTIKLLTMDHLKAVKEMAKLIWDGNDYLGKVAKSWIEDNGFMGLFLEDKLIGCGKITHLPDRVIWLEGLRINPDYQAQGWGKYFTAFVMKTALHLIDSGEADTIEFSTYYKNEESIHIATEGGFRLVEEYYVLTHKSVKPASVNRHQRLHDDVTNSYPTYLPYGWKFLHPVKASINWLNKRVTAMHAEGGYFYVGGEIPSVCLLSPAGEWISKALPTMQYLIGRKEDIEIILPVSRKAEVDTLLSLGFKWWEEDTPDMVQVYRYYPPA